MPWVLLRFTLVLRHTLLETHSEIKANELRHWGACFFGEFFVHVPNFAGEVYVGPNHIIVWSGHRSSRVFCDVVWVVYTGFLIYENYL